MNCPNWGRGPCGFDGGPCGKCVHLDIKPNPVKAPPVGPTCDSCPNPLLLHRPGRTRCERCRLDHAMTNGTTTTSQEAPR